MTAAPGERLRRPARLRSVDLGPIRVSYVPDGAVQLVPHGWFPETTEEIWARHPEYVDDTGHLAGSLGGLLIEYANARCSSTPASDRMRGRPHPATRSA